MQRRLEKEMLAWKESDSKKPLLLRGIRQVGKTWLMKSFGKKYFRSLAYISCDKSSRIKDIFAGDFDVRRMIPMLEIAASTAIVPQETLLVLDEIQEVPRAVTALKYFHEDAPQYHIMAAGSLLGVADLEGTGFPVGAVDFLDMHPLSFTEFLEASGQERLSSLLQSGEWSDIMTFKDTFIEYLRYYFFTGGMPEPVAMFAEHRDFRKVRKIQQTLLKSYDNDFAKHAPKEIVERIRLVWNSIPAQLGKENRKFVFGALRKGARSAEFELAIQWLCNAGLASMVYCASKPDIPLSAYRENAFKLMPADVGLLAAQSHLDLDSILGGNTIFEEFKGALTEQYVYQQLIAEHEIVPFYWASKGSQCEIDYLYQSGKKMIPHEVKAGENLRSRSLMFFSRKYRVPLAVRSSMSDYRIEDVSAIPSPHDQTPYSFKLLNLPLYAVCRLQNELKSF